MPYEWSADKEFTEMQLKVRQMKVVNDTAERGIALIQAYNSSITKDEEQKQFLLRLVAMHRKNFPEATKAALLTMTE